MLYGSFMYTQVNFKVIAMAVKPVTKGGETNTFTSLQNWSR